MNKIEIIVKDNGPGIPKKILNRIFNIYFTTKPSGTGIGLGIVQRIIDEHGGSLSVHSEEGKGTEIRIMLPRQVSSDL